MNNTWTPRKPRKIYNGSEYKSWPPGIYQQKKDKASVVLKLADGKFYYFTDSKWMMPCDFNTKVGSHYGHWLRRDT